ncbi:MAG TPA: hydroxyacid dehydrogenase [Candidatus Latescibacteria bacterium]|nr:hydroxyacid dehydrogenase [Candidatus Latescibacterota bacterium]
MKVLLTGPIYPPGTRYLKKRYDVRCLDNPTEAEIAGEIGDADAVITRLPGITARVIEAARRLKVIGRFGVGYDNVDVVAATDRGIPVVYTPGVNARTVAEHAMGLILALARRLVFWDRMLKDGRWELRDRERGVNISGKTLGIIGMGRIGSMAAQLARALGMEVVAHDPFVEKERIEKLGVRQVGLDELFRLSDFISIHVPLTEGTRGMVNRERLRSVKDGAMLVNTSRGQIVEIEPLYEMLQSGKLGGVALDVFPEEPPDVGHPIFRHPNFIGTPHVSSMTETLDEMGLVVAQEVSAVLEGQRPRYVANPEVFQKVFTGDQR